MIRILRALCIAAALFFGPLLAASAEQGVPAARMGMLARGINISGWFSPWSEARRAGVWLREDDAALIRRLGFTFVRLTASPEWAFNPGDPSNPPPVIRYYDHAVHLFLDAGLAVIVDPIHGTSSDDRFEDSLARDAAFRKGVEDGWEALARRYSALSPDRIFFEVMNEPHISTRELIDASWWAPVQQRLAAANRRRAPQNTIIATGEKWGGIDGLLLLKPLPDPNVVYSFHWYDPFTFTHQGAEWAGDIQKMLADVPYPSTPEVIAPVYDKLTDPRARRQVSIYGGERWAAGRIAAGLGRAADWGKRNGVPVFCGEFGVYRKVAPPADRVRWIADVRSILEDIGIGWSMWDYDGGFGLVRYSSPGERAGRILDGLTVSALGLTPGAWSATSSGEIVLDLDPVAAFLAGTQKIVNLPASAWPRLWSRDASAASVTLQEVPSLAPTALRLLHTGSSDWAQSAGLKVPVTPGESFTLTGAISLETGSAGTVSLEVVTYDAVGTVLSWSFAGQRADAAASRDGAGMQTLTSTFVVAPGVAVIEPRWSGSGPAQVRLGVISLQRN